MITLLPCVLALALAGSDGGFLHGTVATRTGEEHTGYLRWGEQEASWDDLFQSARDDRRWREHPGVPTREVERRRIHVLGLRISVGGRSDPGARVVTVRFGDLTRIDVLEERQVRLTLKNGETVEVEGYSDDVASDITVAGKVVAWEDVASVAFAPAPAGASRGEQRLHGEVETRRGTFTGYIMWDHSETLATDELDGDEATVKMGDIVSIARAGRLRSEVVLRDGRELTLSGTNDVNHDNRGILIEDPRFGKVDVGWDDFDRVTFTDPPGSGPDYAAYPPRGDLHATVTAADGARHGGRLVLDLDESQGWEMLDGRDHDVRYTIPLHRVRKLSPGRRDCEVVLDSGVTLLLDEDNTGILVGDRYLAWEDIREIEFQ